MLTLSGPEALHGAIRDPTLAPSLRAVLALRFGQLAGEGADFHVLCPGDAVADAEQAVGWPLLLDQAPCWEWSQRHPGGWIEVVFVLSDDGPAQVLLVPEQQGVDPALIALLTQHAPAEQQAEHSTPA